MKLSVSKLWRDPLEWTEASFYSHCVRLPHRHEQWTSQKRAMHHLRNLHYRFNLLHTKRQNLHASSYTSSHTTEYCFYEDTVGFPYVSLRNQHGCTLSKLTHRLKALHGWIARLELELELVSVSGLSEGYKCFTLKLYRALSEAANEIDNSAPLHSSPLRRFFCTLSSYLAYKELADRDLVSICK